MMERYNRMATPPDDALNAITAGRLKGFTDINAQWRIEKMTEEYGECGIGWRFEIKDKSVHTLPDGQIILFIEVALYTKQGDEWSHPIVGMGGDFIVKMENKGLRANDEAHKMCLTDALGNAMRNLGMAADVYRKKGNSGTKYSRTEQDHVQKQDREQPQEQQAWKKENGKVLVLSTNGKWYDLDRLPMKNLHDLLDDPKYKGIKWSIQKAIKEKQADG